MEKPLTKAWLPAICNLVACSWPLVAPPLPGVTSCSGPSPAACVCEAKVRH